MWKGFSPSHMKEELSECNFSLEVCANSTYSLFSIMIEMPNWIEKPSWNSSDIFIPEQPSKKKAVKWERHPNRNLDCFFPCDDITSVQNQKLWATKCDNRNAASSAGIWLDFVLEGSGKASSLTDWKFPPPFASTFITGRKAFPGIYVWLFFSPGCTNGLHKRL